MPRPGENEARVASQDEGGGAANSGPLDFYSDLAFHHTQGTRSSGPLPRQLEGAAGGGTAGTQLEGATRDADPRQPQLE
jgi:hypothetical protein